MLFQVQSESENFCSFRVFPFVAKYSKDSRLCEEYFMIIMGCGFSNTSTAVGDPSSGDFLPNVNTFNFGRMERVRKKCSMNEIETLRNLILKSEFEIIDFELKI